MKKLHDVTVRSIDLKMHHALDWHIIDQAYHSAEEDLIRKPIHEC